MKVNNMEKYIYKLTNLINNKIYIGQTNNIERRMKEHMYDKRKNKPIHSAIEKYGVENFSLQILYYGEDYNKEEKKWIEFYKSNNKENGYNIQSGGEDSSGENNPMSKITQEQANEIIYLLLNTNLSYNEIADKINLDIRYVQHINHGEAWSIPQYTYPLRNFANRLTNDKVQEIILLLKDDSKSIDDIVEITQEKRSTILNINKGSSYKQQNEQYPIKYLTLNQEEKLNKIIHLLQTTTMTYEDIAKETNISSSNVYRINSGKMWYNESINYPIRKKRLS